MRQISVTIIALSFILSANSQPTIAFDKTISSKFETIIAALPELIKTFGKTPSPYGKSKTSYTSGITVGITTVDLIEDAR